MATPDVFWNKAKIDIPCTKVIQQRYYYFCNCCVYYYFCVFMLICGARARRKTANVVKMSSVLLGPALNSTYFFDHWFTLPLCLMALSSLHTMDTTSLLLALYPAQHMHNALQDHIGRREGSCLCHQENCIQCRADLWHQNQPHRRLTRQDKNIPSWAQTFSPLLYVKSINVKKKMAWDRTIRLIKTWTCSRGF